MSYRHDWAIPIWLFRQLDREFGFQLDAAASAWNAKCRNWMDDSLGKDWLPGPVWLNPPYGSRLPTFMEKVAEQHARGVTIVTILPGRSDAAWFHNILLSRASEIRFLTGRIAFVPAPDHEVKNHRPLISTIIGIFRDGRLGPPMVSSVRAPRNSKALWAGQDLLELS